MAFPVDRFTPRGPMRLAAPSALRPPERPVFVLKRGPEAPSQSLDPSRVQPRRRQDDEEPPRSVTPEPAARREGPFLTPERKGLLIRPLPATPSTNPYAGAAWYQIIESKLKEMEKFQKEVIEEGEEEDFIDKAPELLALVKRQSCDQPKDLLLLLKLLASHLVPGVERAFYYVLNELCEEVPAINEYMRKVSGQSGEGPVLTPKGVQKILEFFETTYDFAKGVLSTQPVSRLPFLVEEMTASYKEGEFRGWAVYCDNFEAEKHIVPVFAICHGGKVHVFVTDSLGHNVNEREPRFTLLSPALNILRSRSAHLGNRIELYSYQHKRQNGQVECAVFSILDLKCLYEMHVKKEGQSILEFCLSQSEPFRPKVVTREMLRNRYDLPFNELSALPPSMMKSVQSLTQFRKLEALYAEYLDGYDASRFDCYGETHKQMQDKTNLFEKVRSSTFKNLEGYEQNYYATKKRFSYIVYLITSILDQS